MTHLLPAGVLLIPTGDLEKGESSMNFEGRSIAVGIDAAVANHHVIVQSSAPKDPGRVLEDFVVPPTLAGMATLTKRLAPYLDVMAVAEPT